jgi:hypothetical protein
MRGFGWARCKSLENLRDQLTSPALSCFNDHARDDRLT